MQPRNRGTAAGILLPLVRILGEAPDARVVVLPSDHHVADEAAFRRATEQAAAAVLPASRPPLSLVGIAPDTPETSYGWIVPTRWGGVEAFVEKPDRAVASALLLRGALWNAFTFAARGDDLLRLYDRTCPALLRALELGWPDLERTYETLPALDFSRDLLERIPERLTVVRAPACGWTDLGTPERLRAFLAELTSCARAV